MEEKEGVVEGGGGEREGGGRWRERERERVSTSFTTGSSVDPTLLDKLEDVLSGYRKPTCLYSLRYHQSN